MKRSETSAAPATTVARLVADLANGAADEPFADELSRWLSTSARFLDFATTYRAKIRKKVRTASDDESLRDVRAELLAARLLLDDRRFAVVYEAYGSGRGGPDHTVTYRTSTCFNLEVTRLRKPPDPPGLGETLLAKLRQLPPSTPNVLVMATDRPAPEVDVAGAVRALRARADARDDPFFERRGLTDSRGFYDRFLRLSVVIGWCDRATGSDRAELWTNPSARIAIPEPAARACLDRFRADVVSLGKGA